MTEPMQCVTSRCVWEPVLPDLPIEQGDYHEGMEEGIKIGRGAAIADAALVASRPAGNRHQEFSERQSIIVRRIRALDTRSSELEPTND